MKILLSITFCFVTFFAIGQVTGDIEKDTALANQYFEEALISQSIKEKTTLLEKSIELYEAYPIHEKLIEIKGEQAIFFVTNRKRQEGQALAEVTIKLAINQLSLSENDPVLAKSYSALQSYYSLNNLRKSYEYGEKVLQCLSIDNPMYINALFLNITNLINSRNSSLAHSLINRFEGELNAQKENASKRNWLIFFKVKMRYYQHTGNYEQGLIYGQKLFTDNEKYKVFRASELSNDCITMGNLYTALNNYDDAFKWLEKARLTTSVSTERADYGQYYHDFGDMFLKKRDYPKAIENFQQAIHYYKIDSTSMAQLISIVYYRMGTAYEEQKEYDLAIENYQISKAAFNSPVHDHKLGKNFAAKGDYEKGIKHIHNSLLRVCTNFKNTDIYENPSLYENYTNTRYANMFLYDKGRILVEWGKAEKDANKIKVGLELSNLTLKLEEAKGLSLKGFDKSTKVYNRSYLQTLSIAMDGYYELYKLNPSVEHFNYFYQATEKRKAIQLLQTLSLTQLSKELYLQEKELIKNLQKYGRHLDLVQIQEKKDSIVHYQEQLFQASQQLESFMKSIKEQYPKQMTHFLNNNYSTIEELQASIPKNSLLLSYNYNGKNSDILAISRDNQEIYKADITALNRNILMFNELIQDRFAFQTPVRNEFIDISHELYNTLIKPIEHELEGKSELMIVVEGELFNLPFELLLPTNEKKPYHELDFLIKKYEINYHYSATAMLRLMEKETVRDNSMLAFAPIFSKGDELTEATRSLDFMVDSLYRSIEDFEFVALPNTKTEVTKIAKLIKSNNGQANILLHKNATKTNLSQQLEKQSYQFVHIATHGLVNFKNPRLSALACFSKNETMDNLMYANEIQFKDINADLVVLSSCESGIGQLVQGEGLIALNRSFIYSGAKNVLFSLWKVNDKYSSELMIDFYKYYLEGQSYTTALRNAKLKMLENPTSAQPNFWAAFILMGQ